MSQRRAAAIQRFCVFRARSITQVVHACPGSRHPYLIQHEANGFPDGFVVVDDQDSFGHQAISLLVSLSRKPTTEGHTPTHGSSAPPGSASITRRES